jgi:hypothetical protein
MTNGGERCSDLSRAAGEPLAATATSADRWLLVEVPGSWPRDVAVEGTLPDGAQEAVSAWLADTPRSRLLFLRRPAPSAPSPAVFVVRAEEAAAETRRIEVERHEDLAGVDLDSAGEPVETRLALVCGHGSRDACCALRGTAVFTELAGERASGDVWISSHHGGHRFAGNVLVLPLGIHLGRLDPPDARRVVELALEGHIDLAHYRGRTCYEPRVQAAEHAIREAFGLARVEDLRLSGLDDAVVRFRAADGNEHAAVVGETDGPVVPASCGAAPEPQRTFTARLV